MRSAWRTARLACPHRPYGSPSHLQTRTLFGFGQRSKPAAPESQFRPTGKNAPKKQQLILEQDNLFHPLSRSPFPDLRARAESVKSMAPCPVCLEEHGERRNVQFDCPDCGWPTHATEQHWALDRQKHAKYCSRLREANEDEHDLRSGRRIREFELPGEQAYEAAVSFANWDTYWFTRDHPSIDSERPRRHLTKLLTYPTTVSSVLHEFSGLTTRNQRVTPEGARSLAALRMTLHQRPSEGDEESDARRLVRLFILGARAESSLPPHVWQQLPYLFPGARFHIFFIGPQVAMPAAPPASTTPSGEDAKTSAASSSSSGTESAAAPETPASGETSTSSSNSSSKAISYNPPTPSPNLGIARARPAEHHYGVPSYTVSYSPSLSLTSLQASYSDVHEQFGPFDPYQDVFFAFSPGFGFPSPTHPELKQIASPTEWGPTVPLVLSTKCALFVTGFSPTDMERDVRSLDTAEGVTNEFDWVITPGVNPFGSEKWEVADFDPRVMVKVNWGIWGIRGKRREVDEVRRESED
ncbi:hypothetical protein DL93DRAFT_2091312 [Clavulina sp. PMI_390]|nr:hypothetical protein DL93DRAFT_2091312 [Clavulina sp. PMI_390]